MAAPPRRPPGELDPLAQADRAERGGDVIGAAAALRVHLSRHPDDARARLRFARALMASGERQAARRTLTQLEGPGAGLGGQAPLVPADLIPEVHRAFAELDEADGALEAAAERWERVLADDIDDGQARGQLEALRPVRDPVRGGPAETLVTPEGVEALRYRLRRELGRGATAAVYLAHDETLDLDVALKVLHPQLAGPARSDARRRFFAEARLAAAIRHPGVIAIYDVDAEARALSMEYVSGGTLRARLQQSGPAQPDELRAIAASLLDALAYVHARGIVHGDLKPSNLLLRAPGAVVLADFGAAELEVPDEARPPSWRGEGPAGTPLYLAPEQFRGARPSPATDLYAAGAILWEMAAGRPLRNRADLLNGGAHPPPALPPPTTGPLAAVITALVQPDPAARPPGARAALDAVPPPRPQ